jgi:dihydrofolate reductase
MRKVILGLAVSLDGFIEGPNGEYDWCFTDQDYGMSDFFKRIDAIFMGRKSYDLVRSVEGENPYQNISTYVFSKTIQETPEGIHLVSGDLKQEVINLKNQKGKDIWLFGGAELTAAFIQHGLLDELWLSVHPVLLGSGKPLFQQIQNRVPLQLLEQKAYSSGLVSLKYRV